VCPRCGFGFVQPTGVEVISGGRITTVEAGGTRTATEELDSSIRGVVIRLRYLCEEWHEFFVTQEFRKGGTLISIDPGSPDHDPNPTDAPGIIWRD
jgi:hypothetical protein